MKIPDKLLKTWFKIKPLLPLLSAIFMLLIASLNDSLSMGFYQILRILVCGVSGYFCFKSWKEKHYNWTWALGIIAVLFNPVLAIEFDKYTWQPIDFFVALILGGLLFKKRLVKYIVIISLGIISILSANYVFQKKLSRNNSSNPILKKYNINMNKNPILEKYNIKFSRNKFRVIRGGLKSKFPDKFPSKFKDSEEVQE